MFRFTIRDVLWVTLAAAILLSFWRVWPWIDAQRRLPDQRLEPYVHIIPGE